MELNSQKSSSRRIRNGRRAGHDAEDVVGGAERVGRRDLVTAVDGLLELEVERLFLVVDRRRPDVALLELGEGSRGLDLLVATVAGEQAGGDEGNEDDDADPEPHGAEDLLTFHTPMPGAGVAGRPVHPPDRPGTPPATGASTPALGAASS
jgi:hypothetical protein